LFHRADNADDRKQLRFICFIAFHETLAERAAVRP
jgi:hypothetical protein